METAIGSRGKNEFSKPLRRGLLEGAARATATDRAAIAPASFLRKLYRMLRPMPRSPVPKSPDEAHKLQLVPALALTERFRWALRYLHGALGSDMGAYLEFGVYNGSSMICLLDALDAVSEVDVRLFGFDSFLGLPTAAELDDNGVWHAGQFSCPRNITEARLAAAGADRRTVRLVEGWYADTLTAGDHYGVGSASLVMIDSDTYTSACLALDFAGPLLTSPSVIIFDDWKLNDLDVKGLGEYRAFHEWLAAHPEVTYRWVRSYNRKSRIAVLSRRFDPTG